MSGETARLRLRPGRRRLATALIGYGIVGLLIALVALVATLWLWGRIGGLADRTTTQVTNIVATLDRAATALTDASGSATSFATTLERTEPAVRQVAQAIGDLRTSLHSVEDQLGRISILGGQPFANVAGQFGQMATDLEGLDERLGLIASDLASNHAALVTNADSLSSLGDRLGVIASDVGAGTIGDGLGDLRLVLAVFSVLLVVWVALPAVGALWLGWWLRGEPIVPDEPVEPAARLD